MRPDSSSGSADKPVSLGWRSIVVQIGLVATIVTNVLIAGVVFVEIGILGDLIAARPIDFEMVQTNLDRGSTLGSVWIVVLAVAAITWWVWQFRAQKNLHVMGRAYLDHGPWGAVGWWVVPIASLWMPFKVVRELWKGSEPNEDPVAWVRATAWAGLVWWWGLWILGNALQVVSGFATESDDLETVRIFDFVAALGLAFEVFAACLAIGIVRQIGRRQVALASILQASAAAASPSGSPPLGAVPLRPDLG